MQRTRSRGQRPRDLRIAVTHSLSLSRTPCNPGPGSLCPILAAALSQQLRPCCQSYGHGHHPVVMRSRPRSRSSIRQPDKAPALGQQPPALEAFRALHQSRIQPPQRRWPAQGRGQPTRLSPLPVNPSVATYGLDQRQNPTAVVVPLYHQPSLVVLSPPTCPANSAHCSPVSSSSTWAAE